jgi:hypothetical protein
LQAEQGNKQGSLASGHKSGGLVLVLASGLSSCPKNARDLTLLFCIVMEVLFRAIKPEKEINDI